MKVVSVVGMERPPFGYFARQIALLRQAELAECLEHQCVTGERLGHLLWERRPAHERTNPRDSETAK